MRKVHRMATKMMGNRPIWFLNMLAMSDYHDPYAHLSSLSYWSKFMNTYISETKVKGNPVAEAVCRVCLRLFKRARIDFEKLQDDPGHLKSTYRRLRGLGL
jgi:hypothetical protein